MSPGAPSAPPSPADPGSPRRPLLRRPLTWVVAALVAVLVLGAAAVIGLRLYADRQNRAAPEPFSASASATGDAEPGDVAGAWTVGEGSQAGYRVDEVLNGQDVTVVGRTEDTSGTAQFAGTSLESAEVVVDLRTVSTDSADRDASFRTIVVDTAAHPEARFTLSSPVDAASLVSDGNATVTAPGTLEINGRTQEVQVELTLTRTAEDTLTVLGAADLTWSDYGVQAPKQAVVTVEDTGQIEFALQLTRG